MSIFITKYSIIKHISSSRKDLQPAGKMVTQARPSLQPFRRVEDRYSYSPSALLGKPAVAPGVTYDDEIHVVNNKLSSEGSLTYRELCFLTHAILNEELDSWTSSTRVPYVDVVKALDDDRTVLLSWVHLSPRGNRVIAEELGQVILNELALYRNK